MIRPRDFQRSRVYQAENMVDDRGMRLETVGEMQTVVNAICQSRWFRNRFGTVTIMVRDGRGRRRAGGGGWWNVDGRCGYITMPKWSRYLFYILHEITHVIVPSNRAAHGREFARTLLQLVQWKMGTAAGDELRTAYRICGVKYVKVT